MPTVPETANVLSDVIDQRPMGRLQLELIGLCVILAAIDGFDTQVMGFLVGPMAESLGLPAASFGPVFASTLLGLMIGALSLAPLADRIGRKKVLLGCVATFSVFSLLTALTQSYEQLLLVRFLTGLGLGGAIPNLIALVCEYTPRRHARSAVTLVFCGMPLGAMAAGLIAEHVLPALGWRAVFICGALLPLVFADLLWRSLPESVEFLSRTAANREQVARIVSRLVPGLETLPDTLFDRPRTKAPRISPRRLFEDGMWRRTLLLWLPYAMNLLILYSIMSWVPTVLSSARLPAHTGIQAIVLFSLGGVLGSLAQGRLMDALGAHRVLIAEFLVYQVLVLLLVMLPLQAASFLTLLLLMGVLIQGAQAGLNALAAELYPQEIRSTGIGWALGIGRIGSILGPLLGGLMVGLGWHVQQVFMAALIPSLIALCALLAIHLGQRRANASHPTPTY
ncbi:MULTISPECIES: MFS transporter [Pseudomonas]|uniref:MFS transporter n=1 Tax=Pseudomonas TaxID=286 RepID=UPI0015A099D4|nr:MULTISPECIES: MFS transporter [Pseudomonas]NVZ28037.1 MFS transporter [Pseudomonas gingeri]BBP76190.1 MFS transporter [Pseudomonas sp. Ost2]